MNAQGILRHPLSPLTRRTIWALAVIVVIMAIGTLGTKFLTGWRWIDSFYFFAMVATAEGPPTAPPTYWSKVFIGFMAFLSIGTLITASGIIFGPFLGYVFHKGWHFAEKGMKEKEQEKDEKEVRKTEPVE